MKVIDLKDIKDVYIEGDEIVFETEKGIVKTTFNEEILIPGVVLGQLTYTKLCAIKFLIQWR